MGTLFCFFTTPESSNCNNERIIFPIVSVTVTICKTKKKLNCFLKLQITDLQKIAAFINLSLLCFVCLSVP